MPRAAIPGPFASGAKWLLAFLLLGGEMLQPAPLQAVVSGGRISGDRGGTAFADASSTVTADANDPVTWQTSAGELNITASTDAEGTFAIVPEPSAAAVLGIGQTVIAAWRFCRKS